MKTTKLAAVLFSKIADFDVILSVDNHRALKLLAIYENLLESILPDHNGECIDKTGEEYLIIFASAVHAVQFAMYLELAVTTYNKGVRDKKEQFAICVGIHLGEIWQDEGHVYGNGVNIAARIMQNALPGQILVSEDIERQVANKLDIVFTKYEHAHLKNIMRDIVLYKLGEAVEPVQDRHEQSGLQDIPEPHYEHRPEFMNTSIQHNRTGNFHAVDFKEHLKETIRAVVAEAVHKSMQATEIAKKHRGTAVIVTDDDIQASHSPTAGSKKKLRKARRMPESSKKHS